MASVKPTLNQADIDLLKESFITRSPEDINSIKNLIDQAVEDAIDRKELVTKSDLKHLPTKDEFYKSQDKLMKELKAIREEHTVLSGRTSRNSDRLDKTHYTTRFAKPFRMAL